MEAVPEPIKPPVPVQVQVKPEKMNWIQLMQYFVGKGKITRAALYDKKGKLLAANEDPKIPQDEIISITKCLDTNYVVLNKPHFGLFFGDERYLCFRAAENTIIGRTADDFFVAHACEDVVIIAFTRIVVEPKFSCLGEVWTFARELRSRMEISAFIG
ncbi:hypothetical protein FSP39_001458 [Pinctada imbricata]|uniref:Profilin n=1 Tax=Pinctada imbricata TaxID=66713 RepID=A0AA88XPA8_PINIB|nr:hypothetical protein FSP39_001458 [Pinctada imbricata]